MASESHVVVNGERIKECSLLKSHSDSLSYAIRCLLVIIRDVFAVNQDPSLVRLHKAERQF
jgi:hypothetical protein